jgi:hypothetical protein
VIVAAFAVFVNVGVIVRVGVTVGVRVGVCVRVGVLVAVYVGAEAPVAPDCEAMSVALKAVLRLSPMARNEQIPHVGNW